MPIRRRVSDQAEYGGFILAFEPRRSEKIAVELAVVGEASESFSAMDWDFEAREVVFVVLAAEGLEISGAALMERMAGASGTGRLRMRLSDAVLLIQPSTTMRFAILSYDLRL